MKKVSQGLTRDDLGEMNEISKNHKLMKIILEEGIAGNKEIIDDL